MATAYSVIYDAFLDEITDPDLLLLADDVQEEIKRSYLEYAVKKCKSYIGDIDLSLRTVIEVDPSSENYDEEYPYEDGFEADLPDPVIVMLSWYMVVAWLKPYINNAELLRLHMNTKDFNTTSPANMVEKIGARFDEARRRARSLRNEYTYMINDVSTLSTSTRKK